MSAHVGVVALNFSSARADLKVGGTSALAEEGLDTAGLPRLNVFPAFSPGRRWTATGAIFSRRGPDEGLLG
jgi:hypothetical protein